MKGSDVQPMLWIGELKTAMAWYRDRLGCEINVFGNSQDGSPNICAASLDGAVVLLTSDPVLALDGAGEGSGHARLYFHLGSPVDAMFDHCGEEPDVEVIQPPTNQHWGDRNLMLRDPWGTVLILANSPTA